MSAARVMNAALRASAPDDKDAAQRAQSRRPLRVIRCRVEPTAGQAIVRGAPKAEVPEHPRLRGTRRPTEFLTLQIS